jgi:4-hydroxy-tetrahydrodipicolinate reductase
MVKVAISGSKGRMGKALVSCAANIPDLQVVAQIDSGDDAAPAIAGCDVLIDFTAPEATENFLSLCVAAKKAIVIGTTGLSELQKTAVANAARKIPVVYATNFSTGVNTLFWLTRKATEILGEGFDLEVVEMHHRLKKDAPSGTATTLVEILADVRKKQLADVLRHGRKGLVGARTADEIGLHAVRGGDVVGDHTVIFAANGERVELSHKASNRDTFANGALRAAQWLSAKPAGLYDMQDVLGLK